MDIYQRFQHSQEARVAQDGAAFDYREAQRHIHLQDKVAAVRSQLSSARWALRAQMHLTRLLHA